MCSAICGIAVADVPMSGKRKQSAQIALARPHGLHHENKTS
jgi:hypothetical protein